MSTSVGVTSTRSTMYQYYDVVVDIETVQQKDFPTVNSNPKDPPPTSRRSHVPVQISDFRHTVLRTKHSFRCYIPTYWFHPCGSCCNMIEFRFLVLTMTIGRFLVLLVLGALLQPIESLSVMSRRDMATNCISLPFLLATTTTTTTTLHTVDETTPATTAAATTTDILYDDITHGFQYSPEWTGTRLPLLDLETASSMSIWTMGRWPDVILRRPASAVVVVDNEPQQQQQQQQQQQDDLRWLSSRSSMHTLERAAQALARTARHHHAVGLAAQQCGVDASMVYLELPLQQHSSFMVPRRQVTNQQQYGGDDGGGVVWINPVIVKRSPETEMRVWTESCLVLPPTFRATVLRDAWVDVAYQTVEGGTTRRVVRLHGELARAAQHELDHDRGILTLDHVDLEEMENDVMRSIERDGHDYRQRLAYSR